jgi:hypothetical protein
VLSYVDILRLDLIPTTGTRNLDHTRAWTVANKSYEADISSSFFSPSGVLSAPSKAWSGGSRWNGTSSSSHWTFPTDLMNNMQCWNVLMPRGNDVLTIDSELSNSFNNPLNHLNCLCPWLMKFIRSILDPKYLEAIHTFSSSCCTFLEKLVRSSWTYLPWGFLPFSLMMIHESCILMLLCWE